MKTWIVCCLLLGTAAHVHASGDEIDVRAFEFLDVIETADGSVWKGVVTEQTPNVSYKIVIAGGSVHVIKAGEVVKLTKQRNPEYRLAAGPAGGPPTLGHARGDGVAAQYDTGPKLPPPMAVDGLRFDPEIAVVFPTGVYDDLGVETSFAPGVRVGYEALFGNIGIGGGGHARFTYFNLPGETKDAAWLLETQLYGRLAMHISRATPYLGMSVGIDTNYVYLDRLRDSVTSVGFGMNLQGGLQLAATPTMAFDVGFDYHPGTDKSGFMFTESREDVSVSYFALRIGAALRL